MQYLNNSFFIHPSIHKIKMPYLTSAILNLSIGQSFPYLAVTQGDLHSTTPPHPNRYVSV